MLALSVIFIVPDKSTEFQKVYCMVYYFIISHHECMRDRQNNMVTHTLNSRAFNGDNTIVRAAQPKITHGCNITSSGKHSNRVRRWQ